MKILNTSILIKYYLYLNEVKFVNVKKQYISYDSYVEEYLPGYRMTTDDLEIHVPEFFRVERQNEISEANEFIAAVLKKKG